MFDADAEEALHRGDGLMSPEARLLYEVVAFAVLDLQSPDEEARKEAHLFFTASSGGWASMRRLYLDALGIDENYLLRKLGLRLDAPATAPPTRRRTPPRRRQVISKERRATAIPREDILGFIGQRDYVTAGDLVERFSVPIQIAAARLYGLMETGHLERPSRGVYRIARVAPGTTRKPLVAQRVLDALADRPDGLTVREMAWATNADPVSIYEALKRLREDGTVIHESPRWRLRDNTSTSG